MVSEFCFSNSTSGKKLVWIRFPGLNLLFCDESFLLALASKVGTLVKVDSNTLNVERGRFACISVEIDLTKPVAGKVWVNGHWYKVQYEGLHIICGASLRVLWPSYKDLHMYAKHASHQI